ncbi:patatin-domain-containing protein [Imleria badia]|nr:patatin-domain-containing protein [Imleria badia]
MTPAPQLDFASDYVDESHIDAFKAALQLDDHDHLGAASSPGTPIPQSPRIRKVSALSDFAPINLKVKRKRKRERSPEHRQEWLFLLVRWPLLLFIFIIIAAQFSLYIFIRQVVNTKEWLSAWRGRKGELRRRLRASRTYEEWKESALTLDRYLDFHEWKRIDEDPFYDWKLVKKVNRSLKILRERNDVRGVLGVLETCIRSNFAGVESPRLYSETFLGTKNLIESYHDEQERALRFIRESTELSNDEKRRFFKSATTNLGTSALCLSGGASFGYYHVGVVKAFLDAGLLPQVIAGTSAGGLVAALVCTRTDEELKSLLVPELAHKITACDDPFEVWFKRFRKTGARFDSVTWARKCAFFTRGSMTFREAYLRTGRILNISVIPAARHSPTKLLNYVTAPDTVIWSALIASAAVPGILNPVVLMQKLKDGRLVPWNWGSKFKDGSLRVDIPIQALNLYFNVTHPVVSQVNPHVHLFFFAPRGSAGKPVAHRKGKGWRGNFLLSAAEQWLKLELTKNFKVIRDLELLPQLLGQDWSSVFLQRFDGTVTIWPKTRLLDWFRILSDPDPAELQRMIRVGEIVTWPKLHIIENRYRIEQQIMLGRQSVRRAMQRVRSTQTPADTDGVINDSNIPKTLSVIQASTSIEPPLAMDTEAEKAFVNNGTAWYFRRGRPIVNDAVESGNSTPGDAGYTSTTDPLRSPMLRRKWASDLLESRSSPDGDIPVVPDHTSTPQRASGSAHSTFLSKIGRKSVSALSLPFSSPLKSSRVVRSREPSPDRHEYSWSSDSSSEEEETSSPYELKPVRAAGLSSLMQDTQDDSDRDEQMEDVDSD